MNEFDKWLHLFKSNRMWDFNNNTKGVTWLKVRAICRSHQLDSFIHQYHLNKKVYGRTISQKFRSLYNLVLDNKKLVASLDSFLNTSQNEYYSSYKINRKQLIDDLYCVTHYVWGGDQNNSLDKYLISNYVKRIFSYEELLGSKDRIAMNAWEYVQASWYNNWTSFLIESIFKTNPRVISAVGEIKGVDFFIDNVPLDLKVTYFPNQYLQELLKSFLKNREITWLRRIAKDNGIDIPKNLSETTQLYILNERLREANIIEPLTYLNETKIKIITDTIAHPEALLTWLYSNQGEMRFGAENRLFLILINKNNLNESWKLKRAINIIAPIVTSYLNSFCIDKLFNIDFIFNDNKFKALSGVIFIIR